MVVKFLMRSALWLVFALSCASVDAQVDIADFGTVNFLSEGRSINHPNCLTTPLPNPAGTVFTVDGDFPIVGSNILTTPVSISVWRAQCPNGSTEILMQFSNVSGDLDNIPRWTHVVMATEDGRLGFGQLFSFPSELGGGLGQDATELFWGVLRTPVSPTYIVKIDPLLGGELNRSDLEGELAVGFFNIGFQRNSNPAIPGELTTNQILAFQLPASSEMVTVPQFQAPALTGRHSGNWIVEGSSDQGIVLSVAELPNRQLVATVGWFTYNAAGQNTWYTGSTFFTVGDNRINFDLTTINNGQFQGGQPGNRQVIAPASIRVVSCEELQLTYDLRPVGLDNRTVRLRRIFEGETAGYTCRNLQDRR
jgi:hypothetical protein